jgi:hypothetical protein
MTHENADAKAVVFLYRSGNQKNKIILFENYLLVIYRGNKNAFRLEDLDKLYFTRHKILIPIVVGGIISSFSLIAIFVSYYSPLLVISILITGLLVLYLGYNGEDVLVIDLKVKQEFYPLRKVTDNLNAFVHFTNNFLKAGKNSFRWHIFLPVETMTKITKEEGYPVQAFTYEQMREQKSKFAQKNDKTFVALDPFQLKSEVRFEKLAGKKELYPMIYGAINQEAIVKNDEVE